MPPNWKLLPLSKLHDIESLKRYLEGTTTGRVDQLWTKKECSSHTEFLLGKVQTACQGCGLRTSSGGSLEWQLKPWDSQHIVDEIYSRQHFAISRCFMKKIATPITFHMDCLSSRHLTFKKSSTCFCTVTVIT